MTPNSRHDPWWHSGIHTVKVHKKLVSSYLEMSPDALRLYVYVCFALNKYRVDHVSIHCRELVQTFGWSADHALIVATEIEQAGLMRIHGGINRIDFTITD